MDESAPPTWKFRDIYAFRTCGHQYLVAFRADSQEEIERFIQRTAWWNSPQAPPPRRKVPTCIGCHVSGNTSMLLITALADRTC